MLHDVNSQKQIKINRGYDQLFEIKFEDEYLNSISKLLKIKNTVIFDCKSKKYFYCPTLTLTLSSLEPILIVGYIFCFLN